ncbi:DUF287 domain-containing protein, partial [Escherichia coli]|uniref:DUF287 domain-containing protein n=1 Tax=Escherichia coli TaxID=562 RepID=UPI001C56CCB0
MAEIMDDPFDDDDHCDPVIDGWMRTIEIEKEKVWIEELYNADVDGRKEENQAVAKGKRKRKGKETVDGCYEDLKELMETQFKEVGEKMT